MRADEECTHAATVALRSNYDACARQAVGKEFERPGYAALCVALRPDCGWPLDNVDRTDSTSGVTDSDTTSGQPAASSVASS